MNSTDPQAYEKLVDELLASPRYGERWAQHWLDLVRYAESDGYNQDAVAPGGVAVSRLRHQEPERGQALRSVRARAARGR